MSEISPFGQSKLSNSAITSKLEMMKVSRSFGLFKELIPFFHRFNNAPIQSWQVSSRGNNC